MKFAWDPEKEEINKRKHNKILVVIHTFKKEEDKEYVRIISARKATKSEIKQYLERKGK